MKFRMLMFACSMFATPVWAKAPVMPPPSPEPDFAKARQIGESGLKANLFDPSSAQIVYSSGFQWGYAKPVIGKRTWGWIACGSLNAKNRLGGYVGAERFWILSDASGAVSWAMVAATMSTCDTGQYADLQPALLDAPVEATGGNAKLGVAEELGKLAELRDKGIITQVEFDAQKAKLLAR